MARGHKRGSGQRSNWYSESKFSNWSPFDPFGSEINALPSSIKPALTIEACPGTRTAIVVRDLHPRFIRPVTPEDVKATILKVPPEFVKGLEAVYLLGGTAKQEKVALGALFRFGCYRNCRAYLHAFPKRSLVRRFSNLPPPHVVQEYERAGATYTHESDGWVLRFSPDTLRSFYLYDVLLHEIGHHVDRSDYFKKNEVAGERYAAWFTTFCSQQMADDKDARNSMSCDR